MKRYLAFVCLAALLSSCSGSDEPELADMPVIEAWIDSDGHPTVLFTSAIIPDADGGDLVDRMIRWGKVTISDGEREVIMTGTRDSRYFPPYRYFSYDIFGEPGKTYTVTAKYRELYASATCRMLEPTKIGRITFAPAENNDTLCSTTLHFTAPQDVPAYYYLTIREPGKSVVSQPAMLGCKEVVEAGAQVTIPVFDSKQTRKGEPFVAQLRRGHTYAVSLHRVPKAVYDFWRAYDDAIMFSENLMIGANGSLPGNVSGGFGIFGARGTDTMTFTVE